MDGAILYAKQSGCVVPAALVEEVKENLLLRISMAVRRVWVMGCISGDVSCILVCGGQDDLAIIADNMSTSF